MVIKTELCNYSEWKIYPGRGQRFVAKDGRVSLFLSKRARVLGLKKVKAQKITWTTAWRKLTGKNKQGDRGNKRKKRVFKIERAIEGVALDTINKIKNAKPENKKALAQQAVLEIKERKKNLLDKKRAEKKVQNKGVTKVQEKVAQKAAPKKAAPKKAGGK